MCEFYSRIGTTKYTAIRHSNIYGPHDKYDLERSHVFGATVTKVMTAAQGKVSVWGSGEEGRDLLHVDDLTALVENILERQTSPFELVNAGAGHAVTDKSQVQRVIEASGRDLRMEHDLSKPSIPTTLCVDCAKAKALFGWEPKVGLDEGIRRTLEWYNSNLSRSPGKFHRNLPGLRS
jgi:nucleoside-diphosphate-sugar epimerase